jgi:hypothetical protein
MSRIVAYASLKGGVGKTTLAILQARKWAAEGRPVVYVDLDLTGSSVADGLLLRAPSLPEREGRLDLAAPASGLISRDETVNRRLERRLLKRDAPGRCVPYLNDLLAFSDELGSALVPVWRAEPDDGVGYLPSSPIRDDVAYVTGALHHHEVHPEWEVALGRLFLNLLTHQVDFVVDCSTGTFGFVQRMFWVLQRLDLGQPLWDGGQVWTGPRPDIRSELVTTLDRNALWPSIESWVHLNSRVPKVRVRINRLEGTVEGALAEVNAWEGRIGLGPGTIDPLFEREEPRNRLFRLGRLGGLG